MSIGDRIRMRREQLQDCSQEKLAKMLGYSGRSTINKIELNKSKVSQDMVEPFARALQTSPAYLMGWTDDPELTHEQTLELERQGKLNIQSSTTPPQVVAAYGGLKNPKKEELIQLIRETEIPNPQIDLLINMIESWQQ